MHNGIGRILLVSIYPIKYLNEPLLLYESILDNTTHTACDVVATSDLGLI